MKAFLILRNGKVYTGKSIGSSREVICEIVFNTSMTGYLEVMTDPSYWGQAVVMTYPLIGNYGITPDMESGRMHMSGFIVRELSRLPSNFRSQGSIQEFLMRQNVPGIAGIDTRSLTRVLRERGTMSGMITTDPRFRLEEKIREIEEYSPGDAVSKVTVKEAYEIRGSGKRVALIDFGVKKNMVDSLKKRGCTLRVFPAFSTAEEILAWQPEGIMLSNGPGDPKTNVKIVEEVRKLSESGVPIFAICLGHQLMALALGAKTYKLKYGHRGGNHPVKNRKTGRVFISSQNHGYAVDFSTLKKGMAEEIFVNVNDGTNEGIRYCHGPILTVQFHPEACPGPRDTEGLFDEFMSMMGGV